MTTSSDTRALLARLRATAEAAPAGPWTRNDTRVYLANLAGGFDVLDCPKAVELAKHLADFDPPTILRLLAVVEMAIRHRERKSDVSGWALDDALAALGGSDHA